jgi:flagellar assembly protein FliH
MNSSHDGRSSWPRDGRFNALTLRGTQAQDLSSASFDVDLRNAVPVEDDSLEPAREAARSAGYAAGWAQGQQAARAAAVALRDEAELAVQASQLARAEALSRAIRAIAEAAESLERRGVTAATEIEDLIIRSAVELAEALLGRELSDAGERALDAVRRAMSLAPSGIAITVRLHPEDHDSLVGTDSDLSHPGGDFFLNGRPIRVIGDPSLSPGDAMADYAATTIDASLTAAMVRVREVLSA